MYWLWQHGSLQVLNRPWRAAEAWHYGKPGDAIGEDTVSVAVETRHIRCQDCGQIIKDSSRCGLELANEAKCMCCAWQGWRSRTVQALRPWVNLRYCTQIYTVASALCLVHPLEIKSMQLSFDLTGTSFSIFRDSGYFKETVNFKTIGLWKLDVFYIVTLISWG